MQPADDLVFVHKWVHAESGSSDPVTLLLLHGTGGDENALLPVGKELWPGAALLGLRGKVLENGMPSSFRRFTEAGLEDIKSRTEELAQFIDAASKRYDFGRRRLIVVGYSNGANLAASLILFHPHYLAGAVLFRAMVPLVPDLIRDFSYLSVFIGCGSPRPAHSLGTGGRTGGPAKKWRRRCHHFLAPGGTRARGGRQSGRQTLARSRKHSTKSGRLSLSRDPAHASETTGENL